MRFDVGPFEERMGKFVCPAITIAIALASTANFASAQTTNSQAIAAAQALVDDAGELMDAKKFAEACPKLEQATTLLPEGVGARLALAECYEGLGKLASAQGQYLQAEALAEKNKDTRRAREAATEAKRLKPKLATITLSVPPQVKAIDGVRLAWDGVVWEPVLWGAPIPVDIGKHTLELQAPGWKPWKAEVSVETNGKATEQAVPMLEKLPEVIEKKPPPRPPPPASNNWLIPVGIGIAAAGVGLGVGFTIAASSKDTEAFALADKIRFERNSNEQLCPASSLDPRCSELQTLQFDRDTASRVAIAGFAVGGAAAVGVTIFAIVNARKTKKTESPQSSFVVWPSNRGILVTGTF